MDPESFRSAGHLLVNEIADFLGQLPKLKVTTSKSPTELREVLPEDTLPIKGMGTNDLILGTTKLLIENSLFNGHPKFWGYITSSAAPLGALADLLAASINPNLGAQTLSPIATEIEKQTIKWLGDFIGYGKNSKGIFVSGGNMANFLGYLAAKKSAGTNSPEGQRSKVLYCPIGTHTWVQKALDLFGGGTDIIRWVRTNAKSQMDIGLLEQLILEDLHDGKTPFLVVGNAGTVETGAVDQLDGIAALCKRFNLWFHVDGAYGALAASLPELRNDFNGLDKADSLAIDPHKWLYSPLEAGCLLVKDNLCLKNAFSHKPAYYNFDGTDRDEPLNFHELGMQNSRGFRALKVWMSLRQIGSEGLKGMIGHDIEMAKVLYERAQAHDNLEVLTNNLSITTFRYIPDKGNRRYTQEYLNTLNQKLLDNLQRGGHVFLSNAIINDDYCLRVCVVNFRTRESDLIYLVDKVISEGARVHGKLEATQ